MSHSDQGGAGSSKHLWDALPSLTSSIMSPSSHSLIRLSAVGPSRTCVNGGMTWPDWVLVMVYFPNPSKLQKRNVKGAFVTLIDQLVNNIYFRLWYMVAVIELLP